MRMPVYFVVICFALMPFCSSCSVIRAGAPVKADYSEEKDQAEAKKIGELSEESWASRYIPGWRAVTGLVPPPSDARKKWDNWNRKRNRSFNTDSDMDGL